MGRFKLFVLIALTLAASMSVAAQRWEKMSESDLRKKVPEKAPVIREEIETEYRTASGISDGKNAIFGVVIITAGYDADGKYTHFLRVGSAIKAGEIDLPKDDYIFGSQRIDADTLRVTFYRAKDGELIGAAKAKLERAKGPIYSFLITPPVEKKGKIFIGRFSIDYFLE